MLLATTPFVFFSPIQDQEPPISLLLCKFARSLGRYIRTGKESHSNGSLLAGPDCSPGIFLWFSPPSSEFVLTPVDISKCTTLCFFTRTRSIQSSLKLSPLFTTKDLQSSALFRPSFSVQNCSYKKRSVLDMRPPYI